MARRFTAEEELAKQAIYERMSPRRRKFVDKVGYEEWDPFQKPFDPIDIRVDDTRLTAKELIRTFLQQVPAERYNDEYARGALELCTGVVSRREKSLGALDFAHWYLEILEDRKRYGGEED